MKKRLMILLAAAALMMVGAAPVFAAPGGVPGPPPGHGKSADDEVVTPDTGDDTTSHVPDWAKAYGKRIIDEYGMPYGHLQQCAGVSDGSDGDEVSDGGDDYPKADLECPEDLVFPEGETGAKAFWVYTQEGMLIVGL